MFEVPPMALTRADAAARLAIGRARWRFIVLYMRICGPTDENGSIIIAK